MPEQVDFITAIAWMIAEFCVMALLLIVIIERSIRRAFRHLGEMTAKDEYIAKLEEEIGYCEKHKKLHIVMDGWCTDCTDEYNAAKREKVDD